MSSASTSGNDGRSQSGDPFEGGVKETTGLTGEEAQALEERDAQYLEEQKARTDAAEAALHNAPSPPPNQAEVKELRPSTKLPYPFQNTKDWLPHEDQTLIKLILDGKTFDQIHHHFVKESGRYWSADDRRERVTELRSQGHLAFVNDRDWKPWEDQKLVDLTRQGMTYYQIHLHLMNVHGRFWSVDDCRAQVQVLRASGRL